MTLIAAGFAVSIPLSSYIGQVKPPIPPEYADSDLAMNGSHMKGFALGMEGLIADWYWMRALQYMGDKFETLPADQTININDLRDLNPRLLYPYLNNATDLDPHFIAAYTYGAVVLPAIDPQKAIAIAEKGIANNPRAWRLYQHLGYIYWTLKQYDQAAATYDQGAAIDGAQPFMRLMAASMRTEGGSRDTARQIFQQMLDGSDDPMVQLTAKRHLQVLESLDERDAVDKALADYQQRTGHCANSLTEIMPALMSVKLPAGNEFRVDAANRLVDPTDTPYLLDKEKCRSALDAEHTGIEVE